MQNPRISFIICTYNRDVYIRQALEAVAQQTCDPALYELLLIDNCSTDNTALIAHEFATRFPVIRYHYFLEEQQGLSHARNRGIKEAKGEILVYLDDDAFIGKEFALELLKFYDARPEIVCTGGKTIPQFENGKPTWMSPFLMPLVAAVDMGDKPKLFPFNRFPIGANMAIRRSMIDEVGLFDVNLGRKGKNLQGGEEKDIFNRIRAKGKQLWYLPTTVAHHVIPASRTTIHFIRRQAHGIGYSERIRVKSIGFSASIKKYFSEAGKWFVTLGLALFYFMILQPQKSVMLIRFRYWVSGGLFRSIES